MWYDAVLLINNGVSDECYCSSRLINCETIPYSMITTCIAGVVVVVVMAVVGAGACPGIRKRGGPKFESLFFFFFFLLFNFSGGGGPSSETS